MKTDYTREELISICERAVVPQSRWRNRDTKESQAKVGVAWALLKAGCQVIVRTADTHPKESCLTNEDLIWLDIKSEGFAAFDYDGGLENDLIYLPTDKCLKEADGGDWY